MTSILLLFLKQCGLIDKTLFSICCWYEQTTSGISHIIDCRAVSKSKKQSRVKKPKTDSVAQQSSMKKSHDTLNTAHNKMGSPLPSPIVHAGGAKLTSSSEFGSELLVARWILKHFEGEKETADNRSGKDWSLQGLARSCSDNEEEYSWLHDENDVIQNGYVSPSEHRSTLVLNHSSDNELVHDGAKVPFKSVGITRNSFDRGYTSPFPSDKHVRDYSMSAPLPYEHGLKRCLHSRSPVFAPQVAKKLRSDEARQRSVQFSSNTGYCPSHDLRSPDCTTRVCSRDSIPHYVTPLRCSHLANYTDEFTTLSPTLQRIFAPLKKY